MNDSWTGDNMIIYYGLGHWPTYNAKTKQMHNGGVPQRGDLVYHLTEVDAQVRVLKPNFTGVAVIDFESWRPLFEHNFDALSGYQELSEEIVRDRYPDLNKTAVKQEAAREFDAGARLFFESTLQLTDKLRPGGHWGFYGFPRYWGGSAAGQAENDKLSYMWKLSRGLFPRIYMDDKAKYVPTKNYIRNTVNETLRVWAKYSHPDTLILPYSLCNSGGKSFFSELLQKYINTTLGPYVKNLTQFLTNCSINLWQRPRPLRQKEYEAVYQAFLQETNNENFNIVVFSETTNSRDTKLGMLIDNHKTFQNISF
nr:hypothetical protein BaRGS_004784 [Batillaria attramentaria]